MEIAKGSSAAAAYRKVWPSLSQHQPTVWCEASKRKNDPKVSLWIREYRLSGASLGEDGRINHAQHVGRLTELSFEAQAVGNYAAATMAEVNAGKASGLYEPQKPPEEPDKLPDQIRAELAELLGLDEDDLQTADG